MKKSVLPLLQFTFVALIASSALFTGGCKKKEKDEVIPFDVSCSQATITYNVRLKSGSHPYFNWFSPGPSEATFREIIWDATPPPPTTTLTSITHAAVTTINLLNGVASPSIAVTTIPTGTYTNIRIGVELQDATSDNIIINGTYTKTDNSTVPIQFRFRSGEVFEASLASYFFKGGTNTTCWLELDPSSWFSTISRSSLDNATLDGSGVMVISSSSNTGIYNIVEGLLETKTTAPGAIVCQ